MESVGEIFFSESVKSLNTFCSQKGFKPLNVGSEKPFPILRCDSKGILEVLQFLKSPEGGAYEACRSASVFEKTKIIYILFSFDRNHSLSVEVESSSGVLPTIASVYPHARAFESRIERNHSQFQFISQRGAST